MEQQSAPQNPLVLSYLALRMAVGIIGIALPFVLAIGKMLLDGPGLQGSISGYYYTDLRDVFVGSLCAIGVFLLSTRGYDHRDEIAGHFASAFAVGVAFFPTAPDCPTPAQKLIGILHLLLAALFLLTLAYFSLFLFTRMAPNPTRRKLQRNMVYRVCGGIILACLALLIIDQIPAVKKLFERLNPIFWLESLAVLAFGFSWLTKGEAILKDES